LTSTPLPATVETPAPCAPPGGIRRLRWRLAPLGLACGVLGSLAAFSAMAGIPPTYAQACPPRCGTPIVTPAWHVHMCDQTYEDQVVDNHCMNGDGVTEFPTGLNQVYIIYCHQGEDLVVVQVKDAAGGLQYVNHPDGITYYGNACETLVFARRNGIPSAGSPYYTSTYWPEGPFTGVSRGIEWYIGLFVAFDQDNYYGTGAEAVITARDPAANADPTVRDTITVHVTSSSDPIGVDMDLREEAPGFPVFKTAIPLRFSKDASDPASGVIKVADHDRLTVRYCPRNCTTPYIDTATWYDFVATITPTPLPTWAGPSPTATATPPPELKVEYVTLYPAPEDVGYVPQISANRNLPNHLGYPTIYAGVWTRGRSRHLGMIQFDLRTLPEGATVLDARLELIGRDKEFTEPGTWTVGILGSGIDATWRQATYEEVSAATVVAPVGQSLSEIDLGTGRPNTLGFDGAALAAVNARLEATQRLSVRIDGPSTSEDNLFGWYSGVDTYNRDSEPADPARRPALVLGYSFAGALASPSVPPGWTATATPPAATPTSTSAPQATPSRTPSMTATAGDPTTVASATASATPWPTPGPSATSEVTPAATPATASAPPTRPGAPDGRQVCLVAFDDRDGDGGRDASERYLPGVTVRLTHAATGAFVTWTTDGLNDPDRCWSGLVDGDYEIAATHAPLGYVPTTASVYRFAVPLASNAATYAFGLRRPPVSTPSPPPTDPTPGREPSPVPATPGTPPATAPPPRTSTVPPTSTVMPPPPEPAGRVFAPLVLRGGGRR
jgi:hypothetical protein